MGRCPTAELVEECSLAKHHVHQMRSRLQIIFSKAPQLIYSVNSRTLMSNDPLRPLGGGPDPP